MDIFLRYFLEFLALLQGFVIVALPVRKQLEKTNLTIKAVLGSVVAVFMISGSFICARYSLQTAFIMILFVLAMFPVYLLLTGLSVPKAVFCYFSGLLTISFSTVYTQLLAAPWEVGNHTDVWLPATSVIEIIITILLTCIFYRFLAYVLPDLLDDPGMNPTWDKVMWFPVVTSILALWVSPQHEDVLLIGRIRIISLILLLFFPFAMWAFFHYLFTIWQYFLKTFDLQKENDILQLQETRYRQLKRYMDATRTLRHDFRQHILAIEKFAREGQNDRLLEYLHEISARMPLTARVFSANKAIDAVAAYYDEYAHKQETVIDWHLNISDDVPFQDIDLCSLLGNLVENALHATEKMEKEKRTITVKAEMITPIMLAVNVVNPYDGSLNPITDDAEHGIGLRSVERTVKKYRGVSRFHTDNGMYAVEILLNAPEKE
ncbi:MAG: GHKL domain-containing protein [Solobacterium sp.]|nr:GHKL domain-containing protein [Solobacterium sp.]